MTLIMRCQWGLLIAAPLLAAGAAYLLISTLLSMARVGPSAPVPHWLEYPPISLASLRAPESTLYAVGFSAVAAALVALEYAHRRLARAALAAAHAARAAALANGAADDSAAFAAAQGELEGAAWSARAACAGLALQGVFPLEGAGGAFGTLLHVSGANLFFLLSLRHAWIVLAALASPALAGLPLSRARAPVAWFAKAASAVAAAAPFVPAALLHPGGRVVDASGRTKLEDELSMERAGFSQHWMVGALVVYYACSSLDFFHLALADAQRRGDAVADVDAAAAAAALARLEARLAAVATATDGNDDAAGAEGAHDSGGGGGGHGDGGGGAARRRRPDAAVT